MARSDELKASPPMFDSRLLDRFTRVHPAVPPLLFGPVITYMLIDGTDRVGAGAAVGLAIGGYLFWTLFEYWLHRLVFHFEPENGVGARLHWMIHGVHHDHPNDPLRLVMPPSVSVPLGVLVLWGFWAVMGYDAMLVFGGAFLTGYLAYDMLHYHLHHHTPKTALGRRLRELHMRHHFQDDERGFGISAPYWDVVFRTAPRRTGKRTPERAAMVEPAAAGDRDAAQT
jgi:sterol desaturase/sphingolipid hydroxylase (fatty acid hydroxylase superfamily)